MTLASIECVSVRKYALTVMDVIVGVRSNLDLKYIFLAQKGNSKVVIESGKAFLVKSVSVYCVPGLRIYLGPSSRRLVLSLRPAYDML